MAWRNSPTLRAMREFAARRGWTKAYIGVRPTGIELQCLGEIAPGAVHHMRRVAVIGRGGELLLQFPAGRVEILNAD